MRTAVLPGCALPGMWVGADVRWAGRQNWLHGFTRHWAKRMLVKYRRMRNQIPHSQRDTYFLTLYILQS